MCAITGKETQKPQCIHLSHRPWMTDRMSVYKHISGVFLLRSSQVYVSRSSCFTDANTDSWQLLEMSSLWSENKWRVRFYSRTKLPTGAGFLQIPGLHSSHTGHLISLMPCSLLQKGKEYGFALTLPIDHASDTGICLVRQSLISNTIIVVSYHNLLYFLE